MEYLHNFVPRDSNGKLRKIPTHGDALSVERMRESLKSRSGDITDLERLEDLEPIPQEFHHRGLMLQVTGHFFPLSLYADQ